MTEVSVIREIEMTMKEAQEKISLAESLSILYDNKHFQKVFLDSYLKAYALSLIFMKTNPNHQTDMKQNLLNKQIEAVGYFNEYLDQIRVEGELAKHSMQTSQTEYNLLLGEE
jgi:hypothetical protein